MSVGTPDRARSAMGISKQSLRRALPAFLGPLVAYALVRPHVSSDAIGLAIAALIPALYGIVVAIRERRIDVLTLLSAIGLSVACLISALDGGASLPLKLHEAAITGAIGLLLIVAVLIGRPIPLGQLYRVPSAGKRTAVLALSAYLRHLRPR